jgi:redox-sensitive bicupin YhaK (pirin superfamily)
MSYLHCDAKIAKSILVLALASFAITQGFTSPASPTNLPPTTCSATNSNIDDNTNNPMKRTMTPLTRVIPKDKLFISEPNPLWFGNTGNTPDDPAWTNGNWLKSRFHFSFAEYNNPRNSHFGVLRVMNDDLVQPKRGFGTHPHRDMEIITYIVNGELTHKDSMGNGESLGRGSIQFMTAGSGIRHSETNDGNKPLRFIQTWIVPRRNGLSPNYGSYNASKDCDIKKNTLLHLASDAGSTNVETPVKVNQDVNCKAAELEFGKALRVEMPEGRQAYLLCVEGALEVNGKTLTKYDGMEIQGTVEGALDIRAIDVEETENGKVAHFLMFDMSAVPGSGRTDID